MLHGAKVIISSRKIDACEKTAAEINNEIGIETAFPIAANIGDDDQLKLLVDETNKKLGKIDVLVCNAATNPFMGTMLEMPIDKAYKYTSRVMSENMMALDAKEGISAFIEKRKPNWKDK